MDCSLPGSSVHGILQARILEWVTISGEFRLPLVLAQGSPIFPSGCEGKLGVALERQYSGLENPMDKGAWRAAVHGVTDSQTRLSVPGLLLLLLLLSC